MGNPSRKVLAPALACLCLAEAADFRRAPVRRRADAALSARFLPARLVAEDAFQVERFRALAKGFRRDSTRHFTATGRIVEVTHDMLAEMAAAGDPAGAPSGALRPSGFSAFLALRHGLRLQAGGTLHAAYVPDDTWYLASPQWGLRNEGKAVEGFPAKAGVDIGIERVWDRFAGSDTLVVAVLDAGWAFRHPELAGRHWVNRAEAGGKPGVDDDGNGYADDSTGWDFVDHDARPDDYNGHGTFVGGVIAAGFDDAKGIAGMLAQGKVMPVRVLDAAGAGDQAQIAEGIRYALRNGAHVINFSIGGTGGLPALKAAFQAARNQGVPIVAAAGNEGVDVDREPTFPASYDFENLVVVGSHGPTGAPSSFSNFGSRVHLSAPGERVLTCGLPDRKAVWNEDFESDGGWTLSSGISMAASSPLSGARSLVWSSLAAVTAAMADTVDLAGLQGAAVSCQIAFTPSDASDMLILEVTRAGSTVWRELAVIAEAIPAGSVLEFALRGLEGDKVRLRFRTTLGANRSPVNRKLRIDDVAITVSDPAPATHEVYAMVDGTSIAAPHVAAFVGLQRLACDRLGLTWTRDRALQGAVADPLLAGKSGTGGRLDAGKGLDFYLSGLPGLVVRDSTVLSWLGGQQVQYAMEVVNPAPGARYRLQASGLEGVIRLDTAEGRVSWTPLGPGAFSLKLLADGPTQLRRRIDLRILPAPPLASWPSPEAQAAGLRVGSRSYRLPAGRPPHGLLEVAAADAAGRTKVLKNLQLTPEILLRGIDLSQTGSAHPFFRVRLDGSVLAEGK